MNYESILKTLKNDLQSCKLKYQNAEERYEVSRKAAIACFDMVDKKYSYDDSRYDAALAAYEQAAEKEHHDLDKLNQLDDIIEGLEEAIENLEKVQELL